MQGHHLDDTPPELVFTGETLLADAPRIKEIIKLTESKTLLDYGSGKGVVYSNSEDVKFKGYKPPQTLLSYWRVRVTCYDPCYPPFSKLPKGKFDGVVCVDVLEHCPEEDLEWIIDELFKFANKFVYANIACGPANKYFNDGENVHSTVHSPDWWNFLFTNVSMKYPSIKWELATTKPGKEEFTWVPSKVFGNI